MTQPVVPETMRAWIVDRPGPVPRSPAGSETRDEGGQRVRERRRVQLVEPGPLQLVELPVPTPAPGELLVRVRVCGVCRTDLHLAEGDLEPHAPGIVPGHEVVGDVVAVGEGVPPERVGDRVGIAWLRWTCGRCVACRRGAENLCRLSRYTGWDAHGGYAEYAVAPADYVYDLPPGYSDLELAPFLCAGIIGFRALRRAEVPPHGVLGIYGFGASAHLAAQVALAEGARVHVMTRSAAARRLALELGAASALGPTDPPPEPLDSAILFAPAGKLVPPALEALGDGGTLAIAGIHLSDIPSLNYQRHLFRERQVRSVTANTRQDGRDFLDVVSRNRIRVTTTPYALDEADVALSDLAADRVNGAAVLVVHRDES